jgi:hypothetical protein
VFHEVRQLANQIPAGPSFELSKSRIIRWHHAVSVAVVVAARNKNNEKSSTDSPIVARLLYRLPHSFEMFHHKKIEQLTGHCLKEVHLVDKELQWLEQFLVFQ